LTTADASAPRTARRRGVLGLPRLQALAVEVVDQHAAEFGLVIDDQPGEGRQTHFIVAGSFTLAGMMLAGFRLGTRRIPLACGA
jgi:hypothetical protein